jgi:FAD/FMN-containing dehydrogenase
MSMDLASSALLDAIELTPEQERQVAAFVELKERVRGELIVAGDAEYEQARRVFNGAVNKFPAVIVRPADAQDVAAAVAYARDAALPLAVRSGSHNSAGLATSDGGVVIDLRPLSAIEIDAERRVARVGPGATNGELVLAAAAHGLAAVTGTCATVGMGGSTLGGGIGWLMGRHGMIIDNVLAFELVTADGATVRASADDYPELFWALCGGGGNFGVVTSITYKLHPRGDVFGGMAIYPMAAAAEVLKLYRDVSAAAPDALIAHAVLTTVPEIGPALLIQACFAGDDPAEGERVLAPLREFRPLIVDLFRPMPYADMYMMLTPPVQFGTPIAENAYTLESPSDEALEAIVACAARFSSPIASIVLHQYRGAPTKVAPDATAFALRQPHYAVANIGQYPGGPAEPHQAWARESLETMRPYASPGLYSNFMGQGGEAEVRASFRANYERLARVKAEYDSANLFRLNQNIAPEK